MIEAQAGFLLYGGSLTIPPLLGQEETCGQLAVAIHKTGVSLYTNRWTRSPHGESTGAGPIGPRCTWTSPTAPPPGTREHARRASDIWRISPNSNSRLASENPLTSQRGLTGCFQHAAQDHLIVPADPVPAVIATTQDAAGCIMRVSSGRTADDSWPLTPWHPLTGSSQPPLKREVAPGIKITTSRG